MEYKKFNPKEYSHHSSFERFGVNFYASEEEIDKHIEDVEKIINRITEALKDSPNFNSISFTDVSAGFIQINLTNKINPGYVYVMGELNHDWENIDQIIDETIALWKEKDNEKDIGNFKEFIDFGNKYGWD